MEAGVGGGWVLGLSVWVGDHPRFWLGGNGMFVPPLLTIAFYFSLKLYVYITLTNNYLAFFIYQLIILWTISINWHRWLLVNNPISKYNSFILVVYQRYINYVSVCPPPPPHTHTHFLAPSYATVEYHWTVSCSFVWIMGNLQLTIQEGGNCLVPCSHGSYTFDNFIHLEDRSSTSVWELSVYWDVIIDLTDNFILYGSEM